MKSKGFFLFESLLLLSLYLFLFFGLFQILSYQNVYVQKQEKKIAQWQNLIGFESLFSQWLSSFAVLACLYPIELHQQKIVLHGQTILEKTPQSLIFYTGDLRLITEDEILPAKAFVIDQDSLKPVSEHLKKPFWLFQYEKQVLKLVQDKIYLVHEGHPQMLVDGMLGMRIQVFSDAIELSIQNPPFFKRYTLCQNFNKDLV